MIKPHIGVQFYQGKADKQSHISFLQVTVFGQPIPSTILTIQSKWKLESNYFFTKDSTIAFLSSFERRMRDFFPSGSLHLARANVCPTQPPLIACIIYKAHNLLNAITYKDSIHQMLIHQPRPYKGIKACSITSHLKKSPQQISHPENINSSS